MLNLPIAETAVQNAEAVENAASQPGAGGSMLLQFGPILLIMVVFMFFMSRSQKKQQQKRQEMLDGIVKGTEVMLGNGIYGKVDAVEKDAFIVEIAPETKIKVAKNGVAGPAAAQKEETK